MAVKNYIYKLMHSKEIAHLEEMYEIECERIIRLWKENVSYVKFSPGELREEFLKENDCETENEFWRRAEKEFDLTMEEVKIVKRGFDCKLLMTEDFANSFNIADDYNNILHAYVHSIAYVNLFAANAQELLPAHIYIKYKTIRKINLEEYYFLRIYK